MKQLVTVIKQSAWYRAMRERRFARHRAQELLEWESRAREGPPPHEIKQAVLRVFAQQYGLKVLVETGTFMGDMIEAMKNDFDRLYTIELSEDLFQLAKERFEGDPRVRVIQGDSGTELGALMPEIDLPSLFWLDGHYSAGVTAKGEKETPVLEELGHIFDATDRGHVILIDDARCFGTDPAYPTLDQVKRFVLERRPDHSVEVADDSIRITPLPSP